jgi:phage baseplate assembly protein W
VVAGVIPHFSLPFRIEGGVAVVVEQDSSAEIADCVAAVCLTLKGQRVEQPGYGISDPAFERGDVTVGALLDEIQPWEPRASLALVASSPIVAAAVDLTIASTPGG